MDNKLDFIKSQIAKFNRVLVAFSAGVDSTLLLKVAVDVLGRDKVGAMYFDSRIRPAGEREEALELARRMGLNLHVEPGDELSNAEFCLNTPRRCYICKGEIYRRMHEIAAGLGIDGILDGSNADDASDYRPGMRAAMERGVLSPLREAGLQKHEIRSLARRMKLPNWDKPSFSCLCSRIPYYHEITPGKLRQVEAAETFLRGLGLREVRVRHHGSLARIEAPAGAIQGLLEESVRCKITGYMHGLGFVYVTMDMDGFRSGSSNEVITEGQGLE